VQTLVVHVATAEALRIQSMIAGLLTSRLVPCPPGNRSTSSGGLLASV
jgi:hypothetical protein